MWHSDGAIAIVDRSKDIIISGGEVGGRHDPDGVLPITTECVEPGDRKGYGAPLYLSSPYSADQDYCPVELSTHPDVLQVSVVAHPHPKWGERSMAFIILHPQRAGRWKDRSTAFERDLKAHARKTLTGNPCPE